MRSRLPILLSTVLTGLACAPASGTVPTPDSRPAPVPAAAAVDTARIVVSGTGSVRVPSDRASIRLAIETEGSTAGDASGANARLAGAVLDAIRPHLGGDDRLETAGYRVEPVNELDPETRRTYITGYRVRNSVVVVLSDLDAVGPVMDAALAVGANRVDDLSFFASNLDQARAEALRIAVAQARMQATAAADALGVPLGAIVEVQTGTSTPGGMETMMMAAFDSRAAGTPVEAGTNVVNANVTITWTLGGSGSR